MSGTDGRAAGGYIIMEEKTTVQGSETQQTTEGAVTEKTYTQAEVDAMLQSEGDRRVQQAQKTWQKNAEKEKAEAEKLRSMDESQRRDYEYEQKVQQLEQREKEFNLAQNKLEATKVMANRGIPIQFVDYIVAEDADTMMENITTFEKAFKAAVADAVAQKIASPSPKVGMTAQTGMTADDFKKLSLVDRTILRNTNPELYNSFINK
jgi:hypothetical protein